MFLGYGYCGHMDKVKCPGNHANLAEKQAMWGRERVHYKMLHGQLKNWGILSQVIRHHISWHGDVFWACAVVMQCTIKNGEPLFKVEYED